MRIARSWLACLALLTLGTVARADEAQDFFESRIRPVLVEHCYSCHNSRGKADGGLKLDYREGLRQGGDSGAAIVPGDSTKSLLLAAIRHDSPDLKMPQAGVKLSARVVADFERWIRQGAFDPRVDPPSTDELAKLTSWEAQLAARKKWWCFQPLTPVVPPTSADSQWNGSFVDRFIRATLDREQITPAGLADRLTLLRRVTYVLTGLPPTPAETESFLHDDAPEAYERLVERLLDSPRFGEHFARHWMDWVRYAESHGSEGDPLIPQAARYRDYLIRALNADVPYDQLVREHLAGDQIAPRVNEALGINESLLGMAHWRMVQHGYAPVDPLDEQVRFIENQIDVVSKAFLGLTVACARCHDHKFDAISQRDFYALYGMLASCRPALVTVDTSERQAVGVAELTELKQQLKSQLAETWLKQAPQVAEKLERGEFTHSEELKKTALAQATHPLHAWYRVAEGKPERIESAWKELTHEASQRQRRHEQFEKHSYAAQWRASGTDSTTDFSAWNAAGTGLKSRTASAGAFHVLPQGEQIVANIYPRGLYTHRLSTKQNGVFTSPSFPFQADELWVRVAGGGGGRARFAVENYPRVIGLLYKAEPLKSETCTWVKWDLRFFSGDSLHVELATAGDLPVEAKDEERSWFGVTDVVARKLNDPEPIELGGSLALLRPQAEVRTLAELAKLYVETLKQAVTAWKADALTDPQAEFLGGCLRAGLLPNSLAELPECRTLVASLRDAERQIIRPTRSPGILDSARVEQPLMIRGDHKQLSEPVPHRGLEAFGARRYAPATSRRELAAELTDPTNPLVPRVIVNRLWHHIFGRGIVATVDNFGRLGDTPTHPELLDYLASDFVQHGYSLKHIIRTLVLSRTFRSASVGKAGDEASERWFARAAVRRLEAEAIRDSLLQAAGQLDLTLFGEPVENNARRRSIYLPVRRNRLDPLLGTFDCPEPYSTRGVRDTTNVPAQSLALLNDPFVHTQARVLGLRVQTTDTSLIPAKIDELYRAILGRSPDAVERNSCEKFLFSIPQEPHDALVAWERARDQVAELEMNLASITRAVIEKLSTPTQRDSGAAIRSLRPLALWEFDGNARDAIGNLHGEPRQARFEQGFAVLDGKSFIVTSPLPTDLTEKTLQAWVELDNLSQRGGGAISVETIGGGVFDGIVFGEKEPGKWLAGSNHFARTQTLAGPVEREAMDRPVCMTVVYARDGKITAYRDAELYGSYQAAPPVTFAKQQSHVLFGLRHSPPGGNKFLAGRLHRAALYDRALTSHEVATAVRSFSAPVSRVELLAALPAEKRALYERWSQELETARKEATRLQALVPKDADDPSRVWSDLALALFNLKEFIYLR